MCVNCYKSIAYCDFTTRAKNFRLNEQVFLSKRTFYNYSISSKNKCLQIINDLTNFSEGYKVIN
jgi:hypothetical protein